MKLEVHLAGDGPLTVVAHPADAFTAESARLLAERSGARVACINLRGLGASPPAPARYTLEAMVDDLEATRRELDLGPWRFWGMSGGGWLAMIYARRHAGALRGVIVESACACFRARLADPRCVLSPSFPAWRPALERAGLLSAITHDEDAGEWVEVEGAGSVLLRGARSASLGGAPASRSLSGAGSALLVSPAPVSDAMRRVMPELLRFDARPWLGELRVPALVIAGSEDPIVPLARAREVHERLAGSRFVTAEGGEHVPSVQGHAGALEAVRSAHRDG